jgi:hypothetical protein
MPYVAFAGIVDVYYVPVWAVVAYAFGFVFGEFLNNLMVL